MVLMSLLNIAYAVLIATYHSNVYSRNKNDTNKIFLIFNTFLALWFIMQGYSLLLDFHTNEASIRLFASAQLFLNFSTIPVTYYLFSTNIASKEDNTKRDLFYTFIPYLIFTFLHFYLTVGADVQIYDRKIGYDLNILDIAPYYSFIIFLYSLYYIIKIYLLLSSTIRNSKSERERKYAIRFSLSYTVAVIAIVLLYIPGISDYSLVSVPLTYSIFFFVLSRYMNKDITLANVSDVIFNAFDKTEQAVAVIDSDFRVKYNNNSFSRYFPENLVRQVGGDISKVMEKSVSKDDFYLDFSDNIKVKIDGEMKYLFFSNSSYYDRWKQYEGSILIFRDATKLTEKKVESDKTSCSQLKVLEKKEEEIKKLNQNLTRALAINHALEDRYEEIREYDLLTGTLNKEAFIRSVNKIIDSKAKKLAIITIKIRDIKTMKDVQGYSFGNAVIKIVADILKEIFGRFVLISRYASETFLIAYVNFKKEEEVKEITESLYDKIKEYRLIDDYETSIKTSSGISIYPDHGRSAIDLIANSELAMYQAEEEEMSTLIFTEEILNEIHETHRLNAEIIEACKKKKIVSFYQPIVKVGKNGVMIRSYEALARWNHPIKGITSPFFFIGVAEKMGSIKEITSLLLNETCENILKFESLGYEDFRFSINISPIELRDAGVFDKIKASIKHYGINPSHLELEITERGLIFDLNFTLNLLSRLKGLGVYISIDDFGTSFSSFNYLKNLPVDKLKIDKSFIDPIGTDDKRDMILKIIIDLSKNLEMETLAEGVENEKQFKFLVENGIEYIQGYYFYKPMSFEEIIDKGLYPGS